MIDEQRAEHGGEQGGALVGDDGGRLSGETTDRLDGGSVDRSSGEPNVESAVDERDGSAAEERDGSAVAEPSGSVQERDAAVAESGESAVEKRREPSRAKHKGSFWRELPVLLVVAVVVAVVVRAFVLQTFYIPSGSMEHTLNINDRVLVNKLVYDFRSPHRGEVVVFEAPEGWRTSTDGKDFIKRVIGVGGDRVACCDRNRITVNGKPLDEQGYLYNQDGVSDPAASADFEATVPEGRLWVMGDHRSESADSLQHFEDSHGDIMESTISADSVVGRAFVLFWPVGRTTWLSVPDTFDDVPDPPGH